MIDVGAVYLSVNPDFKAFNGKLASGATTAGRSFSDTFAKAASIGLAAFGAAKVFTGLIQDASDLSETANKIGVVFGDNAAAIQDFAAAGAQNLGLSQQAALDAAATFGVYGQAAGLAGKANADFSTELTGVASDLASFYNTSPEDAITAIGAALRGESEPLRAYGVLLDDASLRQEAVKQGLIETTKTALTPQQRVLAAHALILAQTTVAQGDFARTSGGLANQQRILAATFENIKATIGSALLPAFLAATKGVNSLITGLVTGQQEGDGFAGLMSRIGEGIRGVFDLVVKGNFSQAFSDAFGVDANSGFVVFVEDLRAKIGHLFDNFNGQTFSDVVATIWQNLQKLWPFIVDLIQQLPSFNTLFNAGAAVLGFFADHVDILYNLMPLIITAFIAWKLAQLAAFPITLATLAIQLSLAASNRALAAALNNLTGAQNVGALAMIRAKIAAAAMWVWTLALNVASKAWAVTQWLLNAALSANPIGIVVGLLVVLGAALYVAWTKSETFRNIVTAAWQAIKDAAVASWEWIKAHVFPPFEAAIHALGTAFATTKDWIGRTWEDIKSAASSAWKWIDDHVFTPFKKGISLIGDAFTGVKNFISGVWGDIIKVITGAVNSVIKVINTFLDGINTIASAVGFDLNLHVDYVGTVDFSASQAAATSQQARAGSGRVGYADGGVYPGYTPGRDIGYIGVSGGEAIMRPEWTRAMETYNPGYVDAANRAARSGGVGGVSKFLGAYAGGGMVWESLRDIVLGQFPTARLTSAYYDRTGDPPYHGTGQAADFAGPLPDDAPFMLGINHWIAGEYPNSTELIHTPGINLYHGQPHTYNADIQSQHYNHVHWAMENLDMLGGSLGSRIPGVVATLQTKLADAAKAVAGPIKDTIAGLTSGSPIMGVVGAAVNKTIDAVVDAIAVKEQSFSDSAAVSGISQSYAGNVATVQADAKKYGWATGQQWIDLQSLLTGESGFNNTAQNPSSSAYGIYQFLSDTWATVGGHKTSDPALQALYGDKYISDRYGSASNAYNTWLSRDPHWYDQGGLWANGTIGVNTSGGPERVLTERQNVAFERLVTAATSSRDRDGVPVAVHVYVGNKEITDIVRVEIETSDRHKAIAARSMQRTSR